MTLAILIGGGLVAALGIVIWMSATRRKPPPAESIERAVTLVGVAGIRSIIATALVQPLMAAGAGAFSRFPELCWEHTLYSALTAETQATQADRSEPFVS